MSAIKEAVESFSKTIPDGQRILDVGCGLRPYEKYFIHGKYVGIDVPKSGRSAEGKKPNFEFDGINIPFEDSCFDVVICTEVLEHATEPAALLSEMNRVLIPSGKLFLTVPFMWGLHELPYDFRRYTVEGIKVELENGGFNITTISKLTTGVKAIQMLISSETSNYLNNIIDAKVRASLGFRVQYYFQQKLLQLVYKLWGGILKFDRVYIDNLVIATKR